MQTDNIKNKVIDWNIRFPVDRWWRKKHNVAFGSSEHRKTSFFDQLFEWEEDRLFAELENNRDEYIINSGDWLKEIPIDEQSERQLIDEAQQEMDFVADDLDKLLNGAG